MKSLLISFLLLLAIPVWAQVNWVEAIPANALGQEVFLGVCTTPSGDVYAAGYAGAGTNFPIVQHYSSSGTPGFTRNLTGNGIAYDVAFDPVSNRVVLGGTLNGRPHLELIDPVTGANVSTAILNGAGVVKGVDVTPTHIYAIGNYSGTLGFSTLSITGGTVFVAKFDLLGNAVQVINITSLNAKGFDVKANAAGDVYFSLTTQGDINFGTGFPGNYSWTSDEEYVLVRANNALQAQWSSLVRRTAFPVTVATEVPVALDEGQGLVYIGSPYEPNTTPTVHGGITSFNQNTGAFTSYAPLPDRTVRDLTVVCGELFATGGRAQSFGRAPCNNAGHAAWYEGYGTTLTPQGHVSANTCSYGEAIAHDDFGRLAIAANYSDANDLTWGPLSSDPAAGTAVVAQVESGLNCCTSSVERCLDFSGTGDVLTFAASPLTGLSAFTLETWFKFDGASSNAFRTIFFNNGPTVLTLGVRNNGLFVRAGGPPSFQVAPVQTGRWHRLSVVYHNGSLITYLDGVTVDQQTVALNLNNEFNIGQQTLTSGNAFSWNGEMDEVTVYDYAKGPGEILAGLDCSPTGNEDGLILYLPLDQGAPGQANPGLITAIDQSPTSNDGTLQNFALNGQSSNWICSDLILPVCPPDTCGAPLAVNTFSRYREHLDVGSAATDKELDLAYGAFRLPQGTIIQTGVVAGSDVHNPIFVAKSEPNGDPIGNPDLYHPAAGAEAIVLLQNTPTPIRNAAGNLTGFLATGIAELPGANQQRVLLRFDTSLTLLNSRFYQPVIPGVRERFTDIIQDSNGDYIAIGNIDEALYNSGFAMRIRQDLSIQHYQQILDPSQDIYLDKVIQGRINTGGPGGGTSSDYLIGGHSLSGELFIQGLPFDLSTSGAFTINLGSTGTGNNAQYVAGLNQLPDGRLAVTGNSKSGEIWLNLITSTVSGITTNSVLIDVDNGTEEAYATALRPGNRLLIGGRAESLNPSDDDGARALLLEFDLNTSSVNWARTYGNANYPESLVLDVYADDDGILLSGYGITLFGTTAGGFFGDLNHFDSWLAATDTVGRVFDCDCYETTFGVVSTAAPIVFGVSIGVLPIVKGQDDLEQDRTKASIVDDFCDQYVVGPAGPICPGGTDEDRETLVDSTRISEANGVWTLDNVILPNGFEIMVDWGDGNMETVQANQLPLTHTYVRVGDYSICLNYIAYNNFGEICWESSDCEEITTSTRANTVPQVEVKAYPNPTDGVVYLSFPLLHGYPEVKVFSAAGRLVRTVGQLRNSQLLLSGLPDGVYILRMRFPDGAMARKRVILQ